MTQARRFCRKGQATTEIRTTTLQFWSAARISGSIAYVTGESGYISDIAGRFPHTNGDFE